MADNVQLNLGTADGAIIATDQDPNAPNAHYQIVKPAFGPLNTFNLVGSTTSNPFPVDMGDNSARVLGTVAVTDQVPGTGATKLGKAVDAVAGATDTGVATLAVRDDVLAALTPLDGDYVQMRTDNQGALWVHNAAVVSVDDNGGSLTVDGSVSLNAGTNNIGDVDVLTLPSIPAGTNNIGDVDVVTFPAEVHSADFDTGVGTDTTLAFGIAVPAAGGAAVVPGDATAGLKVDLGADNDVTVTSGTINANLNAGTNNIGDVDVLTLPSLPAGTNNIGDVDVVSVPAPLNVTGGGVEAGALRVTLANDSTGLLSVDDNGGSLTVDNATLSVTGNGASAGALRVTISNDTTANVAVNDNGSSLTVDGTVTANVAPTTSGGLAIARSLNLGTTALSIKASAGQLYGYYLYNNATAVRFVKLYDAATVTVGTTTPVITIPIPASSAANVEFTNGVAFATAIQAAATTGVADTDTGAPAANDVVANFFYK